ncbi:hypothetical protein BCR32DRAFT_289941 [Anaeromyces robustus]|uniref:Uncharacterized protein n=1 Tax=Anaeromyces robustus TaxID=1754192 RepID=A0A1Y1XLC4_9FUNG|nr:hypothetical protein BCR32DRAFT_289941 [Anaeromyces robustus]|eukprot:ORX86512.1 hypothetical protein BCR32DRAFT_289941 [Anaeromyces robustus]
MANEMSIDDMVKMLQEEVRKVENFDDADGRLDIASMNKQIDNANALLDILEAKYNKFDATLDAMLKEIEESEKAKKENKEEKKEENKEEKKEENKEN